MAEAGGNTAQVQHWLDRLRQGDAQARNELLAHAGERLRRLTRRMLQRFAALQRWEQFRLGWVEAWPADTPIRAGEVVAVLARSLGLWWLNTCRIVYQQSRPQPGGHTACQTPPPRSRPAVLGGVR